MDYEELFSEPDPNADVFQREESCRKTLKTVGKAIFMRVFVMALLGLVVIKAETGIVFLVILALLALMNLGGMLPLIQEWKNRRAELQNILKEMEET